MKNLPAVYPFLFAVFPVLTLYSYNISQTPTKYIVVPIAASLSITALFWAGLRLLVEDRKRRGLGNYIYMTIGYLKKW